jgi:hypothetical protein
LDRKVRRDRLKSRERLILFSTKEREFSKQKSLQKILMRNFNKTHPHKFKLLRKRYFAKISQVQEFVEGENSPLKKAQELLQILKKEQRRLALREDLLFDEAALGKTEVKGSVT